MTTVEVEPWHLDYPPFTVGGSIYAVQPDLRVAAARQLDANGCRVHADVILGTSGEHLGVTPAELVAVRAAVPAARIDLHLIVLADPSTATTSAEQQALAAAQAVAAECITVSGRLASRHHAQLSALRAAGIRVWHEVAPGNSGVQEDIDGVMVMLIEPGTKQVADLSRLDQLARLTPALPAGVDGGVTRVIAARCLQYGAGYIVSGRDLLITVHPNQPVQPDHSPKGAHP